MLSVPFGMMYNMPAIPVLHLHVLGWARFGWELLLLLLLIMQACRSDCTVQYTLVFCTVQNVTLA